MLTGQLDTVPPTTEARARILADYCAAEGLSLAESVAYADSSSDLPMLEAVGFPVAVNPEPRLASIARKRGWLVEDFHTAPGFAHPTPADRPRWRRTCDAARGAPMKALSIDRDALRFGAARLASGLRPGAGARVGPADDWATSTHRSCPRRIGSGSSPAWPASAAPTWPPSTDDPAAGSSRSSRSRSSPATRSSPTHADGRRVVVEPVLGCVARGIEPVCAAHARDGRLGNCGNLAHGHLEPGLQSGYCCDAGGGWAAEMVAHPSQLHEVPDELDDRGRGADRTDRLRGACGARGTGRSPTSPSRVIGAGTLGLLTLAALAPVDTPARLVVAAKHPHQRRCVGRARTARSCRCRCCAPDELARAVRRSVGTHDDRRAGPHQRLTQGADVTIDCVGSADSIDLRLSVTRPGGRVVLVGMPAATTLDLTPLWQREISLTRRLRLRHRDARRPAATAPSTWPQSWWPRRTWVDSSPRSTRSNATRDALEHAGAAGRRGATKIAFALPARDPDAPDHPARTRTA